MGPGDERDARRAGEGREGSERWECPESLKGEGERL